MQSLKLDNGDLPCNVSTIDSEHKKRVDQTRRREELEEGMAGGWRGGRHGPRGTTFETMWRWGRGSRVEGGWGMETTQRLVSHGSAMTLENVCGVI